MKRTVLKESNPTASPANHDPPQNEPPPWLLNITGRLNTRHLDLYTMHELGATGPARARPHTVPKVGTVPSSSNGRETSGKTNHYYQHQQQQVPKVGNHHPVSSIGTQLMARSNGHFQHHQQVPTVGNHPGSSNGTLIPAKHNHQHQKHHQQHQGSTQNGKPTESNRTPRGMIQSLMPSRLSCNRSATSTISSITAGCVNGKNYPHTKQTFRSATTTTTTNSVRDVGVNGRRNQRSRGTSSRSDEFGRYPSATSDYDFPSAFSDNWIDEEIRGFNQPDYISDLWMRDRLLDPGYFDKKQGKQNVKSDSLDIKNLSPHQHGSARSNTSGSWKKSSSSNNRLRPHHPIHNDPRKRSTVSLPNRGSSHNSRKISTNTWNSAPSSSQKPGSVETSARSQSSKSSKMSLSLDSSNGYYLPGSIDGVRQSIKDVVMGIKEPGSGGRDFGMLNGNAPLNNQELEEDNMEFNDELNIETTQLYAYILKATKTSLSQAWRLIGDIPEEDIRARAFSDRSSYLHHLVNQAPEVHRRYNTCSYMIPLIYRLAMRGVKVNALNSHGNTALHLACLKPKGEELYQHLIRIGVDPCIRNKRECRIIHTYKGHRCSMVKGQETAKSGLWNAVKTEDAELVEKLLHTWCRVNTRKNKTPRDIAEETANSQIIKLLDKYNMTNEVVCAAFSCDLLLLQQLMGSKQGALYLAQPDEAWDPPKPLLVALEELGDWSAKIVRYLRDKKGLQGGNYQTIVQKHHHAFEDSQFFLLIDSGTEENILEALEMITNEKVDVTFRSFADGTKGWSYLHLVVDCYLRMVTEHEERSRLLIRAIYRLALAGIEVNARDANGDTALIKASTTHDQNLMGHIIRIGGDASLADSKGRSVNEEVYEDKGKLVLDNKYRTADLPGVWVAIDSNDIAKAERWLKSWSRVNTKRGDRKMVDVARALGRTEIVTLLEEYEHINEFVCATFAGDLKEMMNIIALGVGGKKVNTIDEFFHVGFTWDRHAEFMARPIIITAMEISTPQVVDFLLNFEANLSRQHAESAPCGPVAFWAFREHVSNDNALVVAKHADVELRDELGCTMLHRMVLKNRPEDGCTMLHAAIRKGTTSGKQDIIRILLDRGVDLAARDWEGCTARDYITIYDVPYGDVLRQTIDDFVLELVNNDQHYQLETLLLNAYDHVLDITGLKRKKLVTARSIAELREFKEVLELLDDWEKYRGEVDLLHQCAKEGDLRTVSKLASEKRCAWGRDKAGRTLLHQAVLYQHPELVEFLVEQFPQLISSTDSLMRTPLHICVCLEERHLIWPTLQDGGADPNDVDGNNLSVYDYVRELETPTPLKAKPRGRRWKDYRPQKVIEFERKQKYGVKSQAYEFYRLLMTCIEQKGLSDVKTLAKGFTGTDLSIDNLDAQVLKFCVEEKRESVAKFLITDAGCRTHVQLKVGEGDMSLMEYAKDKGLQELCDLIKSIPEPTTEDIMDGEAQKKKEE